MSSTLTIEWTTKFKRDFKREKRGRHGKTLERDFEAIIGMIADGVAMPKKYRDHALVGDKKDHRDCHIHPDLVLIYRKLEGPIIVLARLGSHSELCL